MAKRTTPELEKAISELKGAGYKVVPERKPSTLKTFYIETEMLKQFMVTCRANRQRIKDGIEEAIRLYLEKHNAQK